MRRAVVSAVVLPLIMLAGAAGAAGSVPAPVTQPPALVALEQKMEQMALTGEAYTQSINTAVTVALRSHGMSGSTPLTRTTYQTEVQSGLASLAPAEASVKDLSAKGQESLQVGSEVYLRLPQIAKRDHGRPWVRFAPPDSSAFQLFPYHSARGELIHEGSGPWAGLINLIATATAPATILESTVLDGQATSQFTVPVEPSKLFDDPLKQLALALGAKEPETLELWIAESGLPVRVALISEGRTSSFSQTTTETTEITSVDPSFTVKAPPRSQTISSKRFEKLLGEFGGLLEAALGKK